ncbi:AlpA family phage regulatory protein [Sphingobium sp. WCS2017Hpa-17]|uniref:helix-turn-helix transcriptional regulator n=1 Tax=Sphingobium sp. WCS2017Hpa-17 TaxID=3073638 RepID=UPI00288A9614|nr:AlpA family phage regulatory protein [Sphingobium sp. WCS2017Hpa-17]
MTTDRLLKISDVMERTALSRSHIYTLVGRGQFPAPRKLGPKCSRWVESHVDAWVRNAA